MATDEAVAWLNGASQSAFVRRMKREADWPPERASQTVYAPNSSGGVPWIL